MLPLNGRRKLSLVSYAHGTTSYRPDVPSTMQDDTMSAPGIAYAAAGFVSSSPDYLGLGSGPGTHPWMDISSETTASVDMLKAARAVVHRHGRAVNRSVYVTGFSQGASAALGLARALQHGADPRSRVAAIAPLSGGYAFGRAELPAMLRGELDPRISVACTSYLLVARNRLYHFYDSLRELFRKRYAGKVGKLFSGSVPGPQMLGSLPADIHQLLNTKGLALLGHPTGRFRASLREIDRVCSGWRPDAPTRLYYVPGDEQAANANTTACRQQFHGAARSVALPDYRYGGSRHVGTVITGVAATLRWFDRLSR
ncbi:MAG TPA: hypothetical protein VHC49_23590 [Mycobacteriales bacterium]|nr:hypothetical protein [Mycobacteriales bacterium]